MWGTLPGVEHGHFSVRYWPGGRRAGSKPVSRTFFSALERNTVPRLFSVRSVTGKRASRLRSYVRVAGPEAADYLQRVLSNDVAALDPGGSFEALLLTPKARVIAPLTVWRRGHEDFLLLTEPELGDSVQAQLLRGRFAAKCEIEPEEHRSTIVFENGASGLPNRDYGVPAVEVLDDDGEPELG